MWSAPAECPCRGRKPAGFSSLCETYPRCETYPQFWSKEQRHGRHALWWLCFPGLPLRGAKTRWVFIPLRNIFDVKSCPFANSTPILAEESAAGRQNTVMWRLCFPCGRAMPPHDGILPAVTMP
ncbi:MAG: hypothetical protein LBK61_03230, partial [Spirochaetaceae bacterium]|nr:hypothetical protein [Spirochaetaceae bacterium]